MLQERLARLRNQLHGLLQIPRDQTINELDVLSESVKILGVLLVPPDQLRAFQFVRHNITVGGLDMRRLQGGPLRRQVLCPHLHRIGHLFDTDRGPNELATHPKRRSQLIESSLAPIRQLHKTTEHGFFCIQWEANGKGKTHSGFRGKLEPALIMIRSKKPCGHAKRQFAGHVEIDASAHIVKGENFSVSVSQEKNAWIDCLQQFGSGCQASRDIRRRLAISKQER
jgi:hypothetical protein